MSYEETPESAIGEAGGEPAAEPPKNALTDSGLGRIVGVLVSPTATFHSIARRPTWIAPLVALLLVAMVGSFVAVDKIDKGEVRDLIEAQMEAQGNNPSDEELDGFVDLQLKIGAGCNIAILGIGLPLIALVMMVVFRMLGGEITFGRSFATVIHSMMPLVVSGVIGIVILLLRSEPLGVREVQFGGVLASNLAGFAPEGASDIVLTILGSLDVFSFWVVALLAIGFATVAGVSTGSAAMAAGALWIVWIVVKVGLAAVGQAFSGGGGG